MQPIINPWIFYWAEVCESVKMAAIVCMILGMCFVIVFSMICFFTWFDDDKHKMLKCAIYSTVITLFFVLIYIFTPTEKTIYKMTIASYLTEDNVAQGKEEIKELVDYIADKIEDAKSEGE